MTILRDRIGHLPGIARLAILGDKLAGWFHDVLMHADVDECLLIEILLVDIADQLLSSGFDAECSHGLDQLSADGQIASVLQLSQVGLVLRLVLGVGDFLHVVVHDGLELVLLHRSSERLQLLLAHVHLLAFEEGVIDLVGGRVIWVLGGGLRFRGALDGEAAG